MLVDNGVTDGLQEGKVDVSGLVFLVVGHQFVEGFVVFAGDGKGSVVAVDVLGQAGDEVGRESQVVVREQQLAHESPGYGIAVGDGRTPSVRQALEGMSYGVP